MELTRLTATGFQKAKIRMLHLPVRPVISWSAACRFWTKTELGMLRTLQLCMTRRILQIWPRSAESWRTYWRRSTQERECAWEEAGIHLWQIAAAASRWRSACHAEHMDPEEHPWLAALLRWRDAMWIETVAAHWNPRDPTRRRLGRGHRLGGKRTWDAPLQQLAMDAGWHDDWQTLAYDGVKWRELETAFVAKVRKVERPSAVPAGRHQLHPTQSTV